MEVSSITMPPKGYLDYCLRNTSECSSSDRLATEPETLTPARWAELDRVNTVVNASVRYVTDAQLYDRDEYWTYPNGRGDCEDFVLAKRKMLLDRGWRPETLLIGVALDLKGRRHAVLIAATDKGDFVLDNQLDGVVAWAATGYTWEKRQTAANANIWVALTGKTAPQPDATTEPLPTLVASAVLPAEENAPEGQVTMAVAESTGSNPDVASELEARRHWLPQQRPSSVRLTAEIDPDLMSTGGDLSDT